MKLVELLTGEPRHVPSHLPRACVGAGVVYRRLVAERVVVGAGETLAEVKLARANQAVYREPVPFVEADGVHHQRVTLPSADRVTEPRRQVVGNLRMLAAIHVDYLPHRILLEDAD